MAPLSAFAREMSDQGAGWGCLAAGYSAYHNPEDTEQIITKCLIILPETVSCQE